MNLHKLTSIPEFGDESLSIFEFCLFEDDVLAQLTAGCSVSDGIGTVLFQQISRSELGVIFGLGDFFILAC